jgi:putative SOS response-associated peptidase YedK
MGLWFGNRMVHRRYEVILMCGRYASFLPAEAVALYAIARQDGQPMAFAGLWDVFKWPDGTATRTFTIITTNANDMMAQLHNRMPVILEQQDWPTWLGEAEGDPAKMLKPVGENVLMVWPVSTQVNSPKNNSPGLLRPVG